MFFEYEHVNCEQFTLQISRKLMFGTKSKRNFNFKQSSGSYSIIVNVASIEK